MSELIVRDDSTSFKYANHIPLYTFFVLRKAVLSFFSFFFSLKGVRERWRKNMTESVPIWLTAQLCLALYAVGVTLPYLFTYVSPKRYRMAIDTAIQRYMIRRTNKDAYLVRVEQARLAMLENNKTRVLAKRNVQYQKESSSSSSSDESPSTSSSSSSEEIHNEREEEEEEEEDNDVLEGLDSIIDLFDTQTVKTRSPLPRRPGRAFRI
jgi:hypothetical protein